jgi:trehalose 6-phosphate synthase/phosphatase
MSPNERAARLSKDYNFVSSHTTSSWLNVAVQDMRRSRATLTAGKGPSRSTLALCDFGTETVAGQPLPTLIPEALARAYGQASRRLIVLGLDGTLIQQEKVLDHLKLFHDFIGRSLAPPPAALHCLQALAADPANSVHVISGRGEQDLESCLGSVRGLGLAAELGFCVLRPHGDVWAKRELTMAQERWKEAARPIFERCAQSPAPSPHGLGRGEARVRCNEVRQGRGRMRRGPFSNGAREVQRHKQRTGGWMGGAARAQGVGGVNQPRAGCAWRDGGGETNL